MAASDPAEPANHATDVEAKHESIFSVATLFQSVITVLRWLSSLGYHLTRGLDIVHNDSLVQLEASRAKSGVTCAKEKMGHDVTLESRYHLKLKSMSMTDVNHFTSQNVIQFPYIA